MPFGGVLYNPNISHSFSSSFLGYWTTTLGRSQSEFRPLELWFILGFRIFGGILGSGFSKILKLIGQLMGLGIKF